MIKQRVEEIKKGQIAPIYVISGEEMYQKDEVKKALDTALIKSEDDQMNRSVYDLNVTPFSEVLEEASSFPFFGERRFIFVENATFLTGKRGQALSDEAKDAFLAYIQSPLETTVLVLVLNGNLDTRNKLGKALKAHAVVMEAGELKPFEVKKIVQQKIKEIGLEISEKDLDYLLFLTGHHLANTFSEIEKFQLFLKDSNKIMRTDIDLLVSKNLEQNIFELTDLLLQGKIAEVIALFEALLLQGEDAIAMNALLITQVRLILQCQILMKLGYNQGNIVSTLKKAPYSVQVSMKKAQYYAQDYLTRLFDDLVEQDYRLKTGYLEPKLLFEFFVLKQGK